MSSEVPRKCRSAVQMQNARAESWPPPSRRPRRLQPTQLWPAALTTHGRVLSRSSSSESGGYSTFSEHSFLHL
eukprot:8068076-Alexandrium_andersonii.AAC.1